MAAKTPVERVGDRHPRHRGHPDQIVDVTKAPADLTGPLAHCGGGTGGGEHVLAGVQGDHIPAEVGQGQGHLLNQAFAASTMGAPDVSATLSEARDIATHTGEGSAFGLMFGPANVELWAMGIALEQDNPDEATAIGRALDPQDIPTPYRRAAYYLDLSAALARTGRTSEAVVELRRAEKAAPQRFQNSPLARELVAGMLQRATRNSDGRELRGLAHRLGIQH